MSRRSVIVASALTALVSLLVLASTTVEPSASIAGIDVRAAELTRPVRSSQRLGDAKGQQPDAVFYRAHRQWPDQDSSCVESRGRQLHETASPGNGQHPA